MKKYYGVLCVSEHRAEITPGHYGRDVTPKKLALGLSTEMPKFREGEKILIDCPSCPAEVPKIYQVTQIVFFDEKDANAIVRHIGRKISPAQKARWAKIKAAKRG